MIRYLVQRPVAILMLFAALLVTGLLVIRKTPVSLLPAVDVPQIVIRVTYPNMPAATLEQNILRSVRESLMNINGLNNIESRAANHMGLVYLTFDYNTKMDLTYIEVNEKLDQLTNTFPRDMPRPQVMRLNTTDIPVIRLQVVPRAGMDFIQVSQLTEKILKKRLEQLEGVSLVDINGKQQHIIRIIPDQSQMLNLGVNDNTIIQTIQQANRDIGGLSIADGQYRYFVKMGNALHTAEEIAALPVSLKDGTIIPLKRLAKISFDPEKPSSYHLYNGKEGLVVTIQKQAESRMNELVPRIEAAVEQFRKDYKEVELSLTQDQTFLLDAGIDNLKQDLLYGGVLTILLLFLFLGNWTSPSLMSISIPLSLIITFIFFYLFGISFNIISLSGLALGIGMLIDNSIVVIDSITRKRRAGTNMLDSTVEGTNEVITPVISQVLTTVAVYVPLVMLSGIGGALVFDQSIALTISLGVSLLVAFVLTPLLYRLLLKTPPEKLKEDTVFYRWVSDRYHAMISHLLGYRRIYFFSTVLLMLAGIWLVKKIPVASLPAIEKKESLVLLDWNAPIDAQENLRRMLALQQVIQPACLVTEAEVGIKQFLLQQENNAIHKADLYFGCKDQSGKMKQDEVVRQWLRKNYPLASFRIIDAPNAFTQLFSSHKPGLEARFRPVNGTGEAAWEPLEGIVHQLADRNLSPGNGLLAERSIDVELLEENMALYGVSRELIEQKLQQLFGVYTISEIKRFGDIRPVRLETGEKELSAKLGSLVAGRNNTAYPLKLFISLQYTSQPKFITADKAGIYKSVGFDIAARQVPHLQKEVNTLARQNGFDVSFTGQYFDDIAQQQQLWRIFLIVLVLLYIILAIQYESLVQPLLVMLTIPLGITGGLFLLWTTGGTLDVMAAIGFVVILGLIVDDPILKIETLNRLEIKYKELGYEKNEALLEKMIHEAGELCLKPLLMVSLTTTIALLPVLFIGGIGNDLQKPLALVIIGGLSIGTFFTTWFVPLAYWYYYQWKK